MCCRAIKTKHIGVTEIAYQCLWSTIWTQTVHNYFKAIVSSVPKIKYCRIEVIIWRRKLAFTTVTLAKYFLYLKEDREDEPERQLVSQRHNCKPQDRRQKQRKKPEECAENLIKQCDAIWKMSNLLAHPDWANDHARPVK